MKNTERIETMTQMLKEIWLNAPELRFNQLIHHLQMEYSNIYDSDSAKKVYVKEEINGLVVFSPESYVDMFYVGDEDFAEYLQLYLNATKEQKSNN